MMGKERQKKTIWRTVIRKLNKTYKYLGSVSIGLKLESPNSDTVTHPYIQMKYRLS